MNQRINSNNKASPQLENGYTRIANELLEAMARLDATRTEWKILMVIIRNTYGYQRKSARIKLADFFRITGVAKPNISRGLSKLIMDGVVIRTDNGKGACYSFQKNYGKWKRLSKQTIVIKNDNFSIIKNDNLYPRAKDKRKKKDNITTQKIPNSPKEQKQKAGIEYTPEGNVVYPSLFEKFWDYYPRKKEKLPTLEAWTRLEKEKKNMNDVVKASKNYRDEQVRLGTAENFIKLPPTFLHKDRWEDYLVSREELQREALRQELESREVRQ
jgi:phage replication O-like protein O